MRKNILETFLKDQKEYKQPPIKGPRKSPRLTAAQNRPLTRSVTFSCYSSEELWQICKAIKLSSVRIMKNIMDMNTYYSINPRIDTHIYPPFHRGPHSTKEKLEPRVPIIIYSLLQSLSRGNTYENMMMVTRYSIVAPMKVGRTYY